MKHQQQIGPNCGIVALSIVAEYYREHPLCKSKSEEAKVGNMAACDICGGVKESEAVEGESAIDFARRSGISYDGEVFCIRAL